MKRYPLLPEVSVQPLTSARLVRIIEKGITQFRGRTLCIGHHNLHSLYLTSTQPEARSVFNELDYCYADGMSVIAIARLLGFPFGARHRATLLDWYGPLLENAQTRGWRLFFLGSTAQVQRLALDRIQKQYPRLKAKGFSGFSQGALAEIREFKPDLVLVGMGMPLQEQWISQHRNKIPAKVLLTAGGLFDYVAGIQPSPPRWLGRIGLEWGFRLLTQPRRLSRRYLLEPWSVLPQLIRFFFSGDRKPVRVIARESQLSSTKRRPSL